MTTDTPPSAAALREAFLRAGVRAAEVMRRDLAPAFAALTPAVAAQEHLERKVRTMRLRENARAFRRAARAARGRR